MADTQVTIDPRYLTYDKDEVQTLLDKVQGSSFATEESVRSIVTDYQTQTEE